MKIFHNQNGQTLLETIIAIGIILIGLLGTITLIIGSLKATKVTENEIIAYHLAKEGIEVARNIRDTNWLFIDSAEENRTWDTGLVGPGADNSAIAIFAENAWTLDFSVNSFDQDCANHPCTRMYLQNSVYSQFLVDAAGYEATPYYRLITLRMLCRDDTGKEGKVMDSGENCATLVGRGELGAGAKKVGLEIESTVQHRAGEDEVFYTLVDRLYNWKPTVADE